MKIYQKYWWIKLFKQNRHSYYLFYTLIFLYKALCYCLDSLYFHYIYWIVRHLPIMIYYSTQRKIIDKWKYFCLWPSSQERNYSGIHIPIIIFSFYSAHLQISEDKINNPNRIQNISCITIFNQYYFDSKKGFWLTWTVSRCSKMSSWWPRTASQGDRKKTSSASLLESYLTSE
jgi:hypothetical protein